MLAGTLVVTGAATGEPYGEPPPPPDFGYRGGGTLGLGLRGCAGNKFRTLQQLKGKEARMSEQNTAMSA